MRSVVLRATVACGLAASGWMAAAPGEAATKADEAAAQALFDEAKQLMASGQFAAACPRLEESQRIDGGVGTLLNLADCYEKTSRLVSAWSTFLDAASAAREAGQPAREQAARDRAAALAPRLPRIVVRVEPGARVPGLTVVRDGRRVGEAQFELPIPIDAGAYTFAASAPGRRPWLQRVVVDGEATLTTVAVPRLAEDAPGAGEGAARSPSLGAQRGLALVAAGVGAAALAVGAGFAVAAKSESDAADAACPRSACSDAAAVARSHDAARDGNLATVSFAAAGVALAAGVVLWLTARPATEGTGNRSTAQLGVGLGAVQVRGAW